MYSQVHEKQKDWKNVTDRKRVGRYDDLMQCDTLDGILEQQQRN